MQRRILEVLLHCEDRHERAAMLPDAFEPPAATQAAAPDSDGAQDSAHAQPGSAPGMLHNGREQTAASPQQGSDGNADTQALKGNDWRTKEQGSWQSHGEASRQYHRLADADRDEDDAQEEESSGEEQLWTTPLQMLQVLLLCAVQLHCARVL